MKSAYSLAMNADDGDGVGSMVEGRGNVGRERSHSRSASWSFAQRRGGSFSALTSVFRDIVPAFVRRTDSNSNLPEIERGPTVTSESRTSSQVSLNLSGGAGFNESDPLLMRDRGWQEQQRGVANRGPLSREDQQGEEQQQDAGGGVEIGDGIRWLEHNTIFIVLLLVKFAWYHRSGLMVILGLFATYFHCNESIRHQVALKNRRKKRILVLVTLFLAGNVYFVYYVFQEQRLYNCLIFQQPHFTVDLWNLLWSICVTDYIVRFATMALKCLVAASFLAILPSRKKGKYYMILEYVSLFYRTLIPLPLWFRYLSNAQNSGTVFTILITALYLMIKGGVIFSRAKELYSAVFSFIQDPIYGTTPPKEEMMESNSLCPICQEEFSAPLMLKCRHVFCEHCVLQWFDRQSTCPLCRATIANDPKWRDGSTAAWPQLF